MSQFDWMSRWRDGLARDHRGPLLPVDVRKGDKERTSFSLVCGSGIGEQSSHTNF